MTVVAWSDRRMRAGYFFGPFGGLVGLPDVRPGVDTDGLSPEVQEKRDIVGRRVLLVKLEAARQWPVQAPNLYPDEASVVKMLARPGQTHRGWWLTPKAIVQNVLTPKGSTFEDWTTLSGATLPAGGYVETVDGLAVHSVNPDYDGDEWRYQSRPVPISPYGGPVTVSMYGRAYIGKTAEVRVKWVIDESGSEIPGGGSTSVAASTTVDSGTLPRLVLTLNPPGGAHGLMIQTRRFAVMANPAVTWTADAGPWSYGEGCDRAFIHDVRSSLQEAQGPGGLQRESLTFTVSEVG